MIYYAAIDTNVLVSAMLRWESVPGKIIELVFDGTIVPLLNEQIVNEYEEVLNRPRFQFQSEMASVAALRSEIERVGFFVDDPEKLEWTLPDFKDRIFYEVVMEKKKTDEAYLITGNSKHFPIEPYVVTPRQMLDIIRNAGE